MSPSDFASPLPLVRRDAVRRLIRRYQQETEKTGVELAQLTDHKQQTWSKMLTDGERSSPPLADLGVLVSVFGVHFLEAWLAGSGYQLTPTGKNGTTDACIMSAGGAMLKEHGDDAATFGMAAADGVFTRQERAALRREIQESRRKQNDLEAKLDAVDAAESRR